MKIIDSHIPYPNKPYSNEPSRIVIHAMGENIQSDNNPEVYDHATVFLNNYKLSAHKLIAPNGDVYVCRFDNERASHARGFNTDSLGVEFLVQGNHNYGTFINKIKTPYLTPEQYESGLMVVRDWKQLHDIQSIDRHSDLSPGRKVDPGLGFPYQEFIRNL